MTHMIQDPHGILSHWEDHMSSYCPGRTSLFELSAEILFALSPSAHILHIADFACGYGGWSRQIDLAAAEQQRRVCFSGFDESTQRLQVYQSVLGQTSKTVPGNLLQTLPEVLNTAPQQRFDAILFGWAAHEMTPAVLQGVYTGAHQLLKQGGIFLIADFMTGLKAEIQDLSRQLTQNRREKIMADPLRQQQEWALKSLEKHTHAHHHQAHHGHHHLRPEHYAADIHFDHLQQAGFELYEEVWRSLNNRLLLAKK